LSQWAPGGRGPRCLAPAAPMVVTPLHTASALYESAMRSFSTHILPDIIHVSRLTCHTSLQHGLKLILPLTSIDLVLTKHLRISWSQQICVLGRCRNV